MPASWITERPPLHRRRPQPVERPRLELPLHQPAFERARPAHRAEPEKGEPEKGERGAVIVDFYL